MIPEHLVRRFISADQDAVVVSGRVPDLDSSEILPVIDKLDKALDKVRAEHPGFEIAVTGLSAIAARNSANMISKLNHGLTIEFLLVAITIGLAIPLGRGDVLLHPARHFPGRGVGHGAVDHGRGAAIRQRGRADGVVRPRPERHHPFLNRLQLESKPGVSSALAVERATVLVGRR